MAVTFAPSILCADHAHLAEQVAELEAAGADVLHFDMMDGQFVPNLTFGPLMLRAVRSKCALPLEAHLMMKEPDWMIPELIESGANLISIHVEAVTHPQRTLSRVRELGGSPGVALNPGTSLDRVDYLLEDADYVLVMSVNPGFAGQAFIPSARRKVEELRAMITDRGLEIDIWMDGSVKQGNVGLLAKTGANVFVLGEALFRSGQPFKETLQAFRKAAESELREKV